MKHVIIRLPKTIEYEPGKTKTLHPYNKFLTDKKRFQANGFDLDEADFDTYGLRRVDGNHVSIFPASFHDEYDDIQRGPQILTRKDIGHIVTGAGLTKDSVVLDAGSGTGALAIYLARLTQRVDTYDIDTEHCELTKKNAEALGIDNLNVYHSDIRQDNDVDNGAYDAFTLDIPQPWEALDTALNALRIGGFLIAYTPQITQAQRVVTEAPQQLNHVKTVDVDVTEWQVSEDVLRPETTGVQHTGYLSFLRRIDE